MADQRLEIQAVIASKVDAGRCVAEQNEHVDHVGVARREGSLVLWQVKVCCSRTAMLATATLWRGGD